MPLPPHIQDRLAQEALSRFLRYVTVHTTSDENSQSHPTSARQIDLQTILVAELTGLGLRDVELDPFGYVYATLPARPGGRGTPFGLLAHVDTSPSVSGENVRPVVHAEYAGGPIRFSDDPELRLTEDDSPELQEFVGDTIITASGLTLLGADDKAGVAEIMAALAVLAAFPELDHTEIHVVFTPDEEVGQGTARIRPEKLPVYCYTVDGGRPGELESECFDAWGAQITFHGNAVHPGFGKNKLVNATTAAARFLAAIPEQESPECTEKREGFFHVTSLSGSEERAHVKMIIRDFETDRNEARMGLLRKLAEYFEHRFKGLKIEIAFSHQYENMRAVMAAHSESIDHAARAIEMTGLSVISTPIRGGTDGSRLSLMGHPTPNLFAGGMLCHSRKEWIAASSLRQAAETLVHLAALWAAPKRGLHGGLS